MDESFAWGTEAVDPSAHDLPGLKASFILNRLPRSGRVLDIGCGGGKFLKSAHQSNPALELHGCDIRPLREPSEDFSFRLVDGATLPYPDRFADAVMVVDVLEHVNQPADILAEVRRVCARDGILVAYVPLEGGVSPYRLFRKMLGDDLYCTTKDHVQAFSHRDLNELISTRFEVLERRYAYHALGGLMDAVFFAMLKIPRLQQLFWRENTYYRGSSGRSTAARVLNGLLVAANRGAWYESRLLSNCRWCSSGVLLVARPIG